MQSLRSIMNAFVFFALRRAHGYAYARTSVRVRLRSPANTVLQERLRRVSGRDGATQRTQMPVTKLKNIEFRKTYFHISTCTDTNAHVFPHASVSNYHPEYIRNESPLGVVVAGSSAPKCKACVQL